MNKYIEAAVKEARKSIQNNDIPVGCVIVEKDKIIARAHNTREQKYKITGHAEINAVEKACKKKKTWHLTECELYTTLEPCKMCLEVIKQARIKKIYYGAKQQKEVKVKKIELEQIQTDGIPEKMIKDFFQNKRN